MRRIGILAAVIAVTLAAAAPAAAPDKPDASDGISLTAPSFDVRLSLGFNYDLLRSLTDVSFDFPVGYMGLNLPLAPGGNILSQDMVDRIFDDGSMFKTPENYKPTAGAGQSANTTIRVDVPMLAGVGSFAYTQNFNFDFGTALGGASLINTYVPIGGLGSGTEDAGYLSLRGALRLPLSINMGWETMTFGYAYRVNNRDDLVFALNLHRHLFSMDTRLRADIDILGHVDIKQNVDLGGSTAPMDLSLKGDLINFSSEQCNGSAQGRFNAEAWTPSVGVKWGRFRLDSRFGLDVKATGAATGKFIVPGFINLEDPSLEEIQKKFTGFEDSLGRLPDEKKFQYVVDFMGDAIPRELDTVKYTVGKMRWKMPQGHTLSFDILQNKVNSSPVLSVSYTKTFGEINLAITGITRETNIPLSDTSSSWLADSLLSVDLGVKVDHIFMLHLRTRAFFANLGLAGLEARQGDNYALKDIEGLSVLRLGDVTMALPVLSAGLTLGTRLQLQLEANILPLPALKTGVNYYF